MKKIFLLFILLASYQTIFATDYYIDSGAGKGGNGTIDNPWKKLDDINNYSSNNLFKAGDHIKFKRGSKFTGNLFIVNTSGFENNEIVYETYGTGNFPKINGMVIILAQKYITVQNLEIYGGAVGIKISDDNGVPASFIKILNNKIHNFVDAGVYLVGGGLNNNYISGNNINKGNVGIYMASDSGEDDQNIDKTNDNPIGCNNTIENNNIYNNSIQGISISSVSLKEYDNEYICDGSTSQKGRNIIKNNKVWNSGCHGLEIASNYMLVEKNLIANNGINTNYGGCSGIHLFDRFANESGPDSDKYERGGDYNIIRNNISGYNKDRKMDRTDGNGIQLDMWCDHNQVYNNISYKNDGAGIIAYGASNNEIYNNTLYRNGVDVGKRFGANEMVILSAEVDSVNESDVQDSNGNYLLVSKNNIVKNNIGLAVNTNASRNPNYGFIDCRYGACRYALAVDDYVINDVGSIGNNIFSNNLWFNSQKQAQAIAIIKMSENEHFQLPTNTTSLSVWKSKNGVSNEYIANPLFESLSKANFHLQGGSPAIDKGQTISLFNTDYENVSRPQGSFWDIGAYEKH